MRNGKLAESSARPSVTLISGGTGAGKTTYALRLCEEIGAIRFSIDDWMTHLFWMDASSNADQPMFVWAMERIGRAETVIRDMAEQILARGIPVVLDLGFTKSEHRKSFANWAESLGHNCEVHWVDVDADTRWERVQGRNKTQGETYVMDVPREMFEFIESEWEDPTSDGLVITRI